MKGMAVYFLHNKDRARSYYNLDFRNRNGTQKRVRSRDLPWAMKQVSFISPFHSIVFTFVLFYLLHHLFIY